MKIIIVFCTALAFCLDCFSQQSKREVEYWKRTAICGGIDSILARKGKWIKEEDAVVFADKTLPKKEYKLVYNRLDSLFALFKETVTDLRGFQPKWYRGMRGGSYSVNGPVPYTLNTLYFDYYCNEHIKKIIVGDETWTWFQVFVNHYNWFAKKIGDWDFKGDGKKIMIFLLPPKVGTWKGKTLYAPQIPAPNTRAVVIGHDGKLPWKSLSRKEYLQGLKDYYIEQRKKYPGKHMDEQIEKIELYLANTDEETLKKPAVVPPKNGISFDGKWEDEEKGGSRVIVFSTAYWKESVPRHAPQFMILYWQWAGAPISTSVVKQLEENFPLEKLKALIDK